jgi:CheY-like chemotaxis protein
VVSSGREEMMRMPKILVCDDDRDIVSALRIYLESGGFRNRSDKRAILS